MSEAADITCPRCDRIDFGFDPKTFCGDCKWTIRPEPIEKPFGFDVLIELWPEAGKRRTTQRHFKGTCAVVQHRCRNVKNFQAVLAMVPMSESVWIGAYGVPGQRM